MNLLRNVIDILCETGTLPPSFRPHKLSGKYEGLWECHIQSDWLLVWDQNDTELILLFTDTGSHADLKHLQTISLTLTSLIYFRLFLTADNCQPYGR